MMPSRESKSHNMLQSKMLTPKLTKNDEVYPATVGSRDEHSGCQFEALGEERKNSLLMASLIIRMAWERSTQ